MATRKHTAAADDAAGIGRIFSFLRSLRRHNDREWFGAHKDDYDAVKRDVETLTIRLIAALSEIDPEASRLTVADCTYRIYRDTRFSADKTPYKTHIGIFINPPRGKKSLTLGYYLHLEPDNSFFCAGTVCLPSPVLAAVRRAVYDNIDEYRAIVESEEFRHWFRTVGANPLKTAPKGFPRDWEWLDYIRPRDFIAEFPLTEAEVASPGFVASLVPAMKQAKRFNDFHNFTIEDFDTAADIR